MQADEHLPTATAHERANKRLRLIGLFLACLLVVVSPSPSMAADKTQCWDVGKREYPTGKEDLTIFSAKMLVGTLGYWQIRMPVSVCVREAFNSRTGAYQQTSPSKGSSGSLTVTGGKAELSILAGTKVLWRGTNKTKPKLPYWYSGSANESWNDVPEFDEDEILADLWANKQSGEWLLNNVDINCRDILGRTPLHFAVREENISAVTFLLRHGADVNSKTKDGETPLRDAIISRRGEIITPKSRMDILTLLMENGADVHMGDKDGKTPLDIILGNEEFSAQRFPLAALFLAHGIDVNARDSRGLTALHRAVNTSSLPAVLFLLDHGADVNSQDNDGETPLALAMKHPTNPRIAPLLESHGGQK